MTVSSLQWQIQPTFELPEPFLAAIAPHLGNRKGQYLGQLLWQRGIRDVAMIPGFLDANLYAPTPAAALGQEMELAIARLKRAYETGEKVAIWGDFDADGITATAVLWEGLGQFFPQEQRLVYVIPNRLTESHGLAIAGLEHLAAQGVSLVVTCDTGSSNPQEIDQANHLGMEVIVTDHHTLPETRPPVVALINPRALPADHALATLSGVAVAYKLVEALYAALPQVPTQPLVALLDLVAIGLIADLVELRGDCRYLAQRGIERLQLNQTATPPPRPGIARLLEYCRKTGDRPTDIAFGLGPRINAISRIHGDARFAVELLTSQDRQRCQHLAEQTELANARRKTLQKDVAQQVRNRLGEMDLSTTSVLVLSDPQWSVGVLGLVAGQIAQEYGRPTILLTIAADGRLARGSARSIHAIDLYLLVHSQRHLLQSFGGHPFAAGLSLPVENLPLFTDAINQQMRQQVDREQWTGAIARADLTVSVAELGQDLFRELKLLEPCGMGNPTPRLFIPNCWFEKVWNRNIQDVRGEKLRYIKTEFEIRDDSGATFPGLWWEHYKDDIPSGRCDAIAELDFNTYHKRYEIRLLALRSSTQQSLPPSPTADWISDHRPPAPLPPASCLPITRCPESWDTLQHWFRRARQEQRLLAIAYPPPAPTPPEQHWEILVGIAKYLSRTGQSVSRARLLDKVGVGDRPLQLGLQALKAFGFQVSSTAEGLAVRALPSDGDTAGAAIAVERFLAAVREERFRQQYFATVPLEVIRTVAVATAGGEGILRDKFK